MRGNIKNEGLIAGNNRELIFLVLESRSLGMPLELRGKLEIRAFF